MKSYIYSSLSTSVSNKLEALVSCSKEHRFVTTQKLIGHPFQSQQALVISIYQI